MIKNTKFSIHLYVNFQNIKEKSKKHMIVKQKNIEPEMNNFPLKIIIK